MKSFSLLIALFCCYSAMGQTPIPTDLYMSFPLDGNATDVGGYNYSGTIVGGVTATTDRFGSASKAMLFNGTTGYIDIPYATSVGTLDFSVSYWANPAAVNAGFVFTKEQTSVATNQFRMGSSGDYFGCFSDITNTYGGGLAYVPTTNVWSFYTITRQGASIKLYVNGVYQSALNTAGTINHSNTLNYRIGSMYSGTTFFNGKIDDLRMFQHALSASEIAALYAYTDPPVITSFTPVTGTIGTTVTINGTGFSATPADNIVYFGAVRATVSASTSTFITVTAPAGAGSIVPVSVTVNSGVAYSVTSTTPRFNYTNTPNIVPKYWTSTYNTGGMPFSGAAADFNTDGFADLVTANAFSDNVSLLMGNGVGGYTAASNYTVGTSPNSVAVGDINGDGNFDIVTANQVSNNISILMGNGSGSFAAAVNYGVANEPYDIAVGDFNNDGKTDIATVNIVANNVSVLTGTGTGSFGSAANFTVGTSPGSILVGDFNADGKADIATANYSSNNVSLLLGNGSGGFATSVSFSVGTGPNSIASGDFNSDGKADIVTANSGTNTVSLLKGNGAGSFGTVVNFTVNANPITIATGDFNGDGKTDIATTHDVSSSVNICLGTGTGSFSTVMNFATGNNPFKVITGDFNNDGRADMAVTDASGSKVNVLIYTAPTVISSFSPVSGVAGNSVTITGTGFSATASDNTVFFGAVKATVTASTLTSITITVPAGAGSVVPVSVTVKGDVACSNTCSTPFFTFTNTPNINPNYQKSIYGSGELYRMTAIGDFNGDGYSDMAAPSYSNIVRVFPGNSDGTFAVSSDFVVGTNPLCVAIGDFNADGYSDLVSANSGSNNVSILLSTGIGSFSAAVNYSVATNPYSVTVGDFNNDGKADIATANYGSNNVSVLLGTGTGSFGAVNNFSAGTNPWSLVSGDFNSDGKADIAVSNRGSFTVSVLMGNGIGGFVAAVSYGVGLAPYTIATGDFNQDGKADLVTANNGPNTVSVLLNAGTGTFGTATDYVAGNNPTSVAIGDFNGDGKTDICTSNGFDNNVSILLGSGTGSFSTASTFLAGSNPASVAVGDFNHDGRADMVATNSNSYNISILLHVKGPIVTTQAVNDIDFFTATGHGNIIDLGLSNPTQHGVVWSTSSNPTIALITKSELGPVDACGAFTSPITGLIPGTVYYMNAYATNADGTTYGDEVQFTTSLGSVWTGTTSSDWNTASNWSNGLIPGSNIIVFIQAGVPNWPTYNGDFTLENQCQNLHIATGAQLTVTGNLNINNGLDLINNGLLRIGGSWQRLGNNIQGEGTVEFYGNAQSNVNNLPDDFYLINDPMNVFPGTWYGDIGFNYDNILFYRSYSGLTHGSPPYEVMIEHCNNVHYGPRRLYCVVNTSGLTELTLQFRHAVQDYYMGGYTVKVEYGFNGLTWNDAGWSVSPNSWGVPATNVTVNLNSEQGVGSSTYYISFTLTGNLWNISRWILDDIKLSTNLPESFYNLKINKSNALTSTSTGVFNVTNNLTLKPGSSLTNVAGSTINVGGTMALESDATGTASYIDNGTTNINGGATVQRYITGSTDLTVNRYHLVSRPLTENYNSVEWTGSYLFESNELNGNWIAVGNSITYPCFADKGYLLYYPAASHVYSHNGTLKSGNSSFNVTFTGPTTPVNYRGYNLIPNMYPCALDFGNAAYWTGTAAISNKIWIWNSASGNYGSKVRSGAGTNGVTDIIPVGQSFFVEATQTGNLAISSAARVHNTAQTYLKNNENLANTLRIKSSANNFADETVIQFRYDATSAYDYELEAKKREGQFEAPQLNSIASDNTKLSINCLPFSSGDVIVPLDFSLNASTEVSLETSGLESFTNGGEIYLEDQTLNKFVNLKDYPVYKFSHNSGNAGKRFQLRFKGVLGMPDQQLLTDGNVFVQQGVLFVDLPSMYQMEVSVQVFDALGHQLGIQKTKIEGTLELPAPKASGLYVVRVISGNKIFIGKVVVN